MTPKKMADRLYEDAYTRWCHEPSDDKNHLTAKDIALYVCAEVKKQLIENLSNDVSAIYAIYWSKVEDEIKKCKI
jgi:hypothetical protein